MKNKANPNIIFDEISVEFFEFEIACRYPFAEVNNIPETSI